MPIPTQTELDDFIREYGPYRLACDECDREDFDGVKELPADWGEITEYQSLKDALSTYDDIGDPPPGYSVFDWNTHFGKCPRCQG